MKENRLSRIVFETKWTVSQQSTKVAVFQIIGFALKLRVLSQQFFYCCCLFLFRFEVLWNEVTKESYVRVQNT